MNATDDILVGEDGKAVYLAVYDLRNLSSAYADWELAADLGEFAAGVKVVVIVDACHSGGLFKEAESSGAKGTRGADAESTPFDLAGRVSAMIDAGRAKRKTRGGDEPEKISSSEIGWAVAAEYYESSMDGGFYHTDEWMGDPTYGNEYYDWTMRKFDYPASYKSGGAFLSASTWGWWSGNADIDDEVGDGDGFCDVYEFWKKGYDFCTGVGTFWYGATDFHPQCTNITVLRSVELGWTVPDNVMPAISPGADRDAIAVVFAGAADAQLRENISDVASYSAYRAWSETVKAPGGGPAVGAGAVWDYPLTWLSFALGADELVSSEPVDGDVSVESFSPSEDLEGGFSFEVGVKGVDIGSGGVAPSVLLANLAKAFSVEGSASLDDPQAFSSDGIVLTFDEPENGKARFTAQPSAPTDGPFFMRVKLR